MLDGEAELCYNSPRGDHMSDVYEVIEAVRMWRGYSMLEVSQKADVKYTTIASLMKRRSSHMSKEILMRLASALGVDWYKMLNCESAEEPTDIFTGRYSDEPRILTELSEMDVKQALREIIGDEYEKFLTRSREKVKIPNAPVIKPASCRQNSSRDQFKQSIDFVLDKLNDDGLMEAMRRMLDIAKDPMYCKND